MRIVLWEGYLFVGTATSLIFIPMGKTLPLLLFLLFLKATAAYSQGDFAAYEKQAKAAGIHPLSIQRYYERGVKISKLKEYKQIGLDLVFMSSHISIDDLSVEESILYSENIFTGTVVRVEYNKDETARFHSTYFVKVSESWKGVLKDTVVIKNESGPVGEQFVRRSEEEILKPGQQVLLFTGLLSPLLRKEREYYATRPEEKEIHLNHVSDFKTLKGSEQNINQAYIIIKGDLFHLGHKQAKNLKEVRSMVKKFVAINNS